MSENITTNPTQDADGLIKFVIVRIGTRRARNPNYEK